MKIFGDARSTNSRKVLATLAELGMGYEYVHVDFVLGQHKHESHVARHPFGQVPMLEDDGFPLYETHAMCRYLNAKADGNLVPGDVRGRAVVDQWMSIEAANFSSHAMKFVYHYLLHFPHDPQVLAHAGSALDKTLGVMATQLAKQPFIGGQAFSLADICFMPYFEYAMLTPARTNIEKHPDVVRWWNTVRERPSWLKVVSLAKKD
jgi:glutathione S-transferase